MVLSLALPGAELAAALHTTFGFDEKSGIGWLLGYGIRSEKLRRRLPVNLRVELRVHPSNVLGQVALRRECSLAVGIWAHVGPLSSVNSLVCFEAGRACVGLLAAWIVALVDSALALPDHFMRNDLVRGMQGHLAASGGAWIVYWSSLRLEKLLSEGPLSFLMNLQVLFQVALALKAFWALFTREFSKLQL